jgi:hypothetical protein
MISIEMDTRDENHDIAIITHHAESSIYFTSSYYTEREARGFFLLPVFKKCFDQLSADVSNQLLPYTSPSHTRLPPNINKKTLIKTTAEAGVSQVNLSTTDGDLGILSDHVPLLSQLRPGVVSAEGHPSYFVAAGFATVNQDSSLHVAATGEFPRV